MKRKIILLLLIFVSCEKLLCFVKTIFAISEPSTRLIFEKFS